METSAINSTIVVLENNAAPDHDYIMCTNANAVEPNAYLEVFKNGYFTADNLLATANAYADGSFFIDIGNDDLIPRFNELKGMPFVLHKKVFLSLCQISTYPYSTYSI